MFIMKLMLFTLSIFVFMSTVKSPFILSLTVLLYSIVLTMFMYIMKQIWLSYVIIMVFSGGLMIILLYTSTLSNENSFLINTLKQRSIFVAMMMSLVVMAMSSIEFKSMNCVILDAGISDLYTIMNYTVLLKMMMYLLLILFIVVKLSENFKGSLFLFS